MTLNDSGISVVTTISLGKSISFDDTNHVTSSSVKRPITRIKRKFAFSSMTSFDRNLKGIENIQQVKVNDDLRHENFNCLCVELNNKFKNNLIIKPLINRLFASPVYVHTVLIIIVFLMLLAIVLISLKIQKIDPRKGSYLANCTYNSNYCDTTIGLKCSTKGFCNCNKDNFWNGSQCRNFMKYLDTGCVSDYMCDQSKSLSCLNSTCKCDSLKKMDSSKQKCRYKYLDCYYDINNSSVIFSQVNSYHFIDICINSCKYANYSYTSIFNHNNQKFCNCLNSIPPIPFQTCDSYCSSKNNEEYLCGSSFSLNIHAYYYNFQI